MINVRKRDSGPFQGSPGQTRLGKNGQRSLERKELPEIGGWQNDRHCGGFAAVDSDFPLVRGSCQPTRHSVSTHFDLLWGLFVAAKGSKRSHLAIPIRDTSENLKI